MKVAAVQMESIPGDMLGNLARMERFAHMAKEADCRLVLFPEISDLGYEFNAIRRLGSSSWEYVSKTLSAIARDLALVVAAGVCISEDGKLFNSLVIWDQQGNILARYDKIHLFCTPQADEGRVFSAGDHVVTFSLDGITFALGICYDLRFPELFRSQTLAGAHALLLASAWPAARIDTWQTLCVARAVENQCFLLAANRVGNQGEFPFGGHSMFISPTGNPKIETAHAEGLIIGDIEMDALQTAREAIPALSQRRPECYARKNEK